MAVHDAVTIAVSEELAPHLFETALAVGWNALEKAVARQTGNGTHERCIVPEIGICQGAADADRSRCRRHRVRLESATRLDECSDAVPQHLDTGKFCCCRFVLGLQCSFPIRVVRTLAISLAGVAAKKATTGLGIDVKMGIDESWMDNAAAGVENLRAFPVFQHLGFAAHSDDRVPAHRDGTAKNYPALGIHRQHRAIPHDGVAGGRRTVTHFVFPHSNHAAACWPSWRQRSRTSISISMPS